MAAAPRRLGGLLSLCLSVALTLAVGAIGGLATAHSVNTWYSTLSKPSFSPPNWLFGPVWTTLYILMGIAAWRIYLAPEGRARRAALWLYTVQLALNLAWSMIFFGLRAPLPALVELGMLLVAIVATGIVFWRLQRLAALLLMPYLVWSSFAWVLNFEIWRLNNAG